MNINEKEAQEVAKFTKELLHEAFKEAERPEDPEAQKKHDQGLLDIEDLCTNAANQGFMCGRDFLTENSPLAIRFRKFEAVTETSIKGSLLALASPHVASSFLRELLDWAIALSTSSYTTGFDDGVAYAKELEQAERDRASLERIEKIRARAQQGEI